MTVADRIGVMNHGRLVQVGDAGGNLRAAELALGRGLRRRRQPDRRHACVESDAGGATVDSAAGRHRACAARRRRQAGRHRLGRAAAGEDPDRARAAAAAARTASPGEVWDIGYLGDVSIYKVRLDERLGDEGRGREQQRG